MSNDGYYQVVWRNNVEVKAPRAINTRLPYVVIPFELFRLERWMAYVFEKKCELLIRFRSNNGRKCVILAHCLLRHLNPHISLLFCGAL